MTRRIIPADVIHRYVEVSRQRMSLNPGYALRPTDQVLGVPISLIPPPPYFSNVRMTRTLDSRGSALAMTSYDRGRISRDRHAAQLRGSIEFKNTVRLDLTQNYKQLQASRPS